MTHYSDTTAAQSGQLLLLAAATALLPILATNLAYLVAISFKSVPVCVPYLDGCTSISSVGRSNPSQWIFKPVMLLSAIAMVAFLVACSDRLSDSHRRPRDIAVCGAIGATALVVYLVFLGTEGETYRMLRRYGVSVYFGFVYLAQLLLARRILHTKPASQPARYMLGVSVLLLVIGVGSIPVTNFVADKDQIENVIEWNFALLMQLNFLLAWWALRSQGDPPKARSDRAFKISDER